MKKLLMLLALAILFVATQVAHAQPPGDGCTYPATYWAANPDQWPVTELEVGQVLRDQAELLTLLEARGNGPDLGALMSETIAAKLNVANGGPADIGPYITWADLVLALGKSNDRRFRPLRGGAAINDVRKALEDYNSLGCNPAAARRAFPLVNPVTGESSVGTMKSNYR
jgi:hypothetical protein